MRRARRRGDRRGLVDLCFERFEDRLLLAIFPVTTTADNGSNTTPTAGSLRAAILSGDDTIEFAIPTTDCGYDAMTGVWTITLPSALPTIDHQVFIDGTKQPGYVVTPGQLAKPVIELNGGGQVIDGLLLGTSLDGTMSSSGSTIQGLDIVNCGYAGIEVQSDRNTISGNYIGPNPSRQAGPGNHFGVLVGGANNRIGGLTRDQANLIGFSNSPQGVGVYLTGGADNDNVVEGNLIGIDPNGLNVGNTYGVAFNGGTGNTIGGTGNTIAFNGTAVDVRSGLGNSFLGNLIYLDGQPIVEAPGTNNDQPPPSNLALTVDSAGNLEVHYTVTGKLVGTYRIEFFASDRPSGVLQEPAKVFLGVTSPDVTSPTQGFSGTFVLSGTLPSGTKITATATGPDGSTSPFATTPAIVNPHNQPAPSILAVASVPHLTTVDFSVTPNATTGAGKYVVKFFASPSSTATAYELLGSITVTVNGTSRQDFTAVLRTRTLPPGSVPTNWIGTVSSGSIDTGLSGQMITATVTDAQNVTSEYAASELVLMPTLIAFTVSKASDEEPGSAVGSLRVAILDADFSPPRQTITFTGPFTISPIAALPPISMPVTIDGTSPLGQAGTPRVVVDGGGRSFDGLVLAAGSGGSTIKGLAIEHFGGATSGSGIHIQSTRDLIIANDLRDNRVGVLIDDVAADTVGGTAAGSANTIGGNASAGVSIAGTSATGNVVAGNSIGTDAAGVGNGVGIVIDGGASNNTIGGTVAGAGNTIADNTLAGVYVASGSGDSILGNLIYHNAIDDDYRMAIVLGRDANHNLPAPSIWRVIPDELTLTIEYTVDPALIERNSRVEFFASDSLGGTGLVGPAARSLGPATPFPATSNGVFTTTLILTAQLASGATVTATVTGPDGSTSSFAVPVTPPPPIPPLPAPSILAVASVPHLTTVDFRVTTGAGSYVVEFFASPSSTSTAHESLGSTTVTVTGMSQQDFTRVLTTPAFPLPPGAVPPDWILSVPAGLIDTGLSGQTITATVTDVQQRVTSDYADPKTVPAPVPFAFTVSNPTDETPGKAVGSLRVAILDVDLSPPVRRITFDIPVTTPYTIRPVVALPPITVPVTIDGTSQKGYAGKPLIELDGGGQVIDGFLLGISPDGETSSSGSTIQGLAIEHFGGATSGSGIHLQSTGDLIIANDLLDNRVGVLIDDVAADTIGGTAAGSANTIGGNASAGVSIAGTSAMGNVVAGNSIGTDAAGVGNRVGIVTDGGAANNTIGGTVAGAGNTIGGNTSAGVSIAGTSAMGNVVAGNSIGTEASATNLGIGIVIDGGASNNTIGGTVAGAGNTVDGHTIPDKPAVEPTGILIQDSYDNTIAGNTITGTGVAIDISGVNAAGIALRNLIKGNLIQTADTGVYLNSASGNTVAENAIEDYANSGINIYATPGNIYAAQDNVIRGNNIDGTSKRGLAGIAIENAVKVELSENFITGNRYAGIYLFGHSNFVTRNTFSYIRGNIITGNTRGVLLTNLAKGPGYMQFLIRGQTQLLDKNKFKGNGRNVAGFLNSVTSGGSSLPAAHSKSRKRVHQAAPHPTRTHRARPRPAARHLAVPSAERSGGGAGAGDRHPHHDPAATTGPAPAAPRRRVHPAANLPRGPMALHAAPRLNHPRSAVGPSGRASGRSAS